MKKIICVFVLSTGLLQLGCTPDEETTLNDQKLAYAKALIVHALAQEATQKEIIKAKTQLLSYVDQENKEKEFPELKNAYIFDKAELTEAQYLPMFRRSPRVERSCPNCRRGFITRYRNVPNTQATLIVSPVAPQGEKVKQDLLDEIEEIKEEDTTIESIDGIENDYICNCNCPNCGCELRISRANVAIKEFRAVATPVTTVTTTTCYGTPAMQPVYGCYGYSNAYGANYNGMTYSYQQNYQTYQSSQSYGCAGTGYTGRPRLFRPRTWRIFNR